MTLDVFGKRMLVEWPGTLADVPTWIGRKRSLVNISIPDAISQEELVQCFDDIYHVVFSGVSRRTAWLAAVCHLLPLPSALPSCRGGPNRRPGCVALPHRTPKHAFVGPRDSFYPRLRPWLMDQALEQFFATNQSQ